MSGWDSPQDVAGSLASGALGAFVGSASQRRQAGYQREFFQHQHQWEVADLIAAGLNPILSATHGPVSGGNVGAVIPPDINSGMKEARIAGRRIDEIDKTRLDLETAATTSAVALNNMKMGTETSMQENLAASALAHREEANNLNWLRANQLGATFGETVARTHNLGEQSRFYSAAGQHQAAQVSSATERARLDNITSKLAAEGFTEAQQRGQVHGAAPALTWVSEILKSLHGR